MYRCVVFAAVSSGAQAEETKASIPSQIENGQKLIRQRDWVEVHPPLVVPGQSRSIDFLHEAMEEIEAIRTLIELARNDQIDVVVVRDYDRLARTRTLLTQISTYLTRCDVQIYALQKPVEPTPPDQASYTQGYDSAAMIEAFAGLEAEREVKRIKRRRRVGMNKLMADGVWKHAKIPYGYTRQTDIPDYLSDVPTQVPEEIDVVKRIERMLIDEGVGTKTIAEQLNLENVPPPTPRADLWIPSSVRHILRNPFYAGYVVWGVTRAHNVYDPKSNRFVKRQRRAEAYDTLREQLQRVPRLEDLIEHADELVEDQVIVVRGEHDPIRTLERQTLIERTLERNNVHPRSGASKHVNLFSGLIVCEECGSTFHVRRSTRRNQNISDVTYVYYRCGQRVDKGTDLCPNSDYVRESYVYERVLTVLRELAQEPGLIDEYLQAEVEDRSGQIDEEIEQLTKALAGLKSRRTRWDKAYEGEVIDLETYAQKIQDLDQERSRLESRLSDIKRLKKTNINQQARRDRILKAIDTIPSYENARDNQRVQAALKQLIESVVVLNGEVKSINFL
jgi:DNA invertase Pin-like site-specific DNA recombinase/esterase/lipase